MWEFFYNLNPYKFPLANFNILVALKNDINIFNVIV